MMKFVPKDVDEYISNFPVEVQEKLSSIRAIIRENAPDAEEKISYQMPAYILHGMLLYFAGYKNHIGFYPSTSGIIAFKKGLSIYKGAKGSVQFPLDQPLPLSLIAEIVRFRVIENFEKVSLKQTKKKGK